MLATLDPKTYFGERSDKPSLAQNEIDKTRTTIENYINKQPATMRFPEQGKRYDWVQNDIWANFTWNHPNDTVNDVKSFEDIYYVDKYYTNSDTQGIGDIFREIFEEITGASFIPISGDNDNGVANALTYMDPIGEYMEVKDNAVTTTEAGNSDMSMLLFGEMHGLVRTGVYDFKYNSEHGITSKDREGWYRNSDNFYLGKGETDGNWEDATYRLSGDTTREYVPTLDEGNLTNKQRNTTYTIYRFKDDYDTRNTYRSNPSYEEDRNVKYKLSDIRVWLEETDDYVDDSQSGAVDLGYDDALFVNIPVEALPIELATITLDDEGNPTSYKTNLEEKIKSTPLRLFYGVGIQDDVRTEDGRTVDITKLSPEYRQKNTDEEGYINFYSNYYSGATHSHGTDKPTTIGDANFTFSPNVTNRYYAFQKPLILYKDDNSYNNKEISEVNDPEAYKKFDENKENLIVDSADDLDSEGQYYIQAEYYMPGDNGEGKLVHVFVPRKGSEFGSEIAGDNIKPGEYLAWYDPGTGDYVPYTTQREDGTIEATPKPAEGNYVIATKPQGLRMGQICVNNVPKGEGNNKTATASSVYYPQISNNTTVNDIIINGYLGNNGRVRIKDTTLEITKEVEGYVGNEDYKDEEFEYTINMPSYANQQKETINAISILKNEKYVENGGMQKWIMKPGTIEVIPDNKGFVQTTTVDEDSGTSSYKLAEYNGKYMYVGLNENLTFDLYDSSKDPYLNPEVTPEQQLPGVGQKWSDKDDGSIEYYATVHLVPKDEVDGKDFDVGTISNYDTEDVVLATLDTTKPIEEQVGSDYYTRTAYSTIPLVFDEAGNAKFTLKHNQGILITGIDAGTAYTVTENLTDKQKQKGYRFDHAYYGLNTRIQSADGRVSGTVNQDSRDIHYVNMDYMPNDISISKVVKGSDSVAEKDREEGAEWHFNMKLKFNDGEDHGDSVSYDYYDKDDTELANKRGAIEFKKNIDGTYTGHFELKHGDNITIKGILSGTEYEITEEEASDHGENPEGYYTTFKNGTDKGVIGGKAEEIVKDIQVECINNNPEERNITIRKDVVGETADTNKEWEFEVNLTPPEGGEISLEDTYPYESSDGKTGTLKLEEPDENGVRKVVVKVKHGEYITIKDLPEGTTYTVKELEANPNGEENQDGYKTEIPENSNGILTEDEDMRFVNSKIGYYELTLRKTVAGHNSGNIGDTFKFKVTFTPGLDGKGFEPINYAYADNSESGRLVLPGTENKQQGDKELIDNHDGSYYIEFTLKDKDIVNFDNILEGTTYNIEEELTESQKGENGYEVEVPDDSNGTINTDNQHPNVEFVNIRYTLHDLTVRKQVTGEAAETNRDFKFKVTFKPAADVKFKTSYPYQMNGVDAGTINVTDNQDGSYTAEFTLKHNQYITIKDIPERTQYSVEEIDANKEGYGTTITEGEANGTLVEKTTEVEFTNKKLALFDLGIQKTVEGDNAERNKDFTFRITLIPAEDIEEFKESYEYTGSKNGTINFTNNQDGTYTGTVTLKGGEHIAIKDITERTQYIVEELEANQDGYITRRTTNSQGILDTNSETVRFVNARTPAHSLSISKEIEGGSTEVTRDWHFEITFTAPEGVELGEKLSYTGGNVVEGVTSALDGDIILTKDQENPNKYVGAVTLKHGQKITIENIPDGTQYSIKEVEADQNGYITYTQGEQEGTITGNVGIVVAYKNKRAQDMDLTLSKTVIGTAGDKNADWHFDIRLTPEEHVDFKTRYQYTGTKTGFINFVQQSDGSYLGTLTLKHNDKVTILGIPSGTRHVISEREANTDGYTTDVTGQETGVITEAGKQIDYRNTKIGYYDLSVNKIVEGRLADTNRDWNFEVVLTIPNQTAQTVNYNYVKTGTSQSTGTLTFTRNALGNYVANFTLKHGETLTIQEIVEGTKYSVTEPEANQDDYVTRHTENCQGTIVDNGITVQYINKFVNKLDLTINKIVRGREGETDRDWRFNITLTPPENVTLDNYYHYTGSKEGNMNLTNNQDGTYTGTITLKHNETVTIENLPEGTKYIVEEVEANQDGYTTSHNGKVQSELSEGTENVTFINTRLSKHDLTLEKIVEGGAGDKSRDWTFEITLTPGELVEALNGSYHYVGTKEGDMTLAKNEDGTYTGRVTLKHNDKITIKDLPEGTTYKVVEVEANKEGYETTNTDNVEGQLIDDNTPEVTFKNTKYIKKDLTIKKTVQGMLGDKNRDWTFVITLTPGENGTFNTTYNYTGSKSGTIEFVKNPDGTYVGKITLKHGETVTIEDLLEGTKYEVIEEEANKDGYVTNVTDNHKGTIIDSDVVVEFINNITPTVTKTILKNNKLTVNNVNPVRNVPNPRTFDNIMQFIALFGLSISIITITIISIVKRNRNNR